MLACTCMTAILAQICTYVAHTEQSGLLHCTAFYQAIPSESSRSRYRIQWSQGLGSDLGLICRSD